MISCLEHIWKVIVIIELLGLVCLFTNLNLWKSFVANSSNFMLFLEHDNELQSS